MKKNPKVILLGQTNSGKTSIIQVLMTGKFQEKVVSTLGACFHRFQTWDSRGESLTMDIWDTTGQERFRSLLTLYYRNSDAVILVFDLSDPYSFDTVDFWARQIQANCQPMPCVILVGNKLDLKERGKGVSKEEINKYLSCHKKWEYIECSAKSNTNINSIFKKVGYMLRQQCRAKEKEARDSKQKLRPSKLRHTLEESFCC